LNWPAQSPEAGSDRSADVDVFGSWSATRWQYASRVRSGEVVDVVAGLKGSVTMSLSAGAFVLAWDVPGHGSGSSGGTAAVADGELRLLPHGGGEPHVVRYRVSAMTLALTGETSAWDFDGSGDVAAEFSAVLVRL